MRSNDTLAIEPFVKFFLDFSGDGVSCYYRNTPMVTTNPSPVVPTFVEKYVVMVTIKPFDKQVCS